jgi:hypothetical protein
MLEEEPPAGLLDDLELTAPSGDDLHTLRSLAGELFALLDAKETIEKELEDISARIKEVSTKKLPELFDKLNMDKIGLADTGYDIVMKPDFYANIAADWPEEERERGFDYLEKLGGGDLVKTVVSVTFGRNEIHKARELQEHLRSLNSLEGRVPTLTRGAQWNTLTSFVKELVTKAQQSEQPIPDLTPLGAKIGRKCTKVKNNRRK